MSTTIDKAGRVVIPKAVRDAMGLTPETPIDFVFADGRIVIDFVRSEWRVATENGLPVLRRDPDADADADIGDSLLTDELIRDTLEAVRDERVERFV